MKNLTLVSSILFTSIFANAGLIEKACYTEQDKKYGKYTVEISIFTDSVTVSYNSRRHGDLGGYRGRIYSANDVKQTAQGVSVSKMTLNDGADGYLDDVSIDITKTTVTFNTKESKTRPQKRVECPK